jgi:hypothetical protein
VPAGAGPRRKRPLSRGDYENWYLSSRPDIECLQPMRSALGLLLSQSMTSQGGFFNAFLRLKLIFVVF